MINWCIYLYVFFSSVHVLLNDQFVFVFCFFFSLSLVTFPFVFCLPMTGLTHSWKSGFCFLVTYFEECKPVVLSLLDGLARVFLSLYPLHLSVVFVLFPNFSSFSLSMKYPRKFSSTSNSLLKLSVQLISFGFWANQCDEFLFFWPFAFSVCFFFCQPKKKSFTGFCPPPFTNVLVVVFFFFSFCLFVQPNQCDNRRTFFFEMYVKSSFLFFVFISLFGFGHLGQ